VTRAIRIEHVGDVALVIDEGIFMGGPDTNELAALTKLLVRTATRHFWT
jgi:hypothetical protein